VVLDEKEELEKEKMRRVNQKELQQAREKFKEEQERRAIDKEKREKNGSTKTLRRSQETSSRR